MGTQFAITQKKIALEKKKEFASVILRKKKLHTFLMSSNLTEISNTKV